MPYEKRDHYHRKARSEGYAARAVYKLREIDERWRILKPGQNVLDLGCAPGSWLQYAAERVGPSGRVVGVDGEPVTVRLPAWVRVFSRDVLEVEADELRALVKAFDVVLSDLAPKTSGVRFTDQARSLALCERALDLAMDLLEPGGSFVCKIFQGPGFPDFLRRVRASFDRAPSFKPRSSRAASKETYVVGLGFRKPG